MSPTYFNSCKSLIGAFDHASHTLQLSFITLFPIAHYSKREQSRVNGSVQAIQLSKLDHIQYNLLYALMVCVTLVVYLLNDMISFLYNVISTSVHHDSVCSHFDLVKVTADLVRVTADLVRVTADLVRVTADLVRVTADVVRVTADVVRVTVS